MGNDSMLVDSTAVDPSALNHAGIDNPPFDPKLFTEQLAQWSQAPAPSAIPAYPPPPAGYTTNPYFPIQPPPVNDSYDMPLPLQQQFHQNQGPAQSLQPPPPAQLARTRAGQQQQQQQAVLHNLQQPVLPTGPLNAARNQHRPPSATAEQAATGHAEDADFSLPSDDEDIERLEQQAVIAKREAQKKRKQIPPFVQKLSRLEQIFSLLLVSGDVAKGALTLSCFCRLRIVFWMSHGTPNSSTGPNAAGRSLWWTKKSLRSA
jgi:hypothetical protein